MGLFDGIKESLNKGAVDRDCERAKSHGLYTASSHRYGCEYCTYVQRANCSTGLACTRKGIVVCANLACDDFEK